MISQDNETDDIPNVSLIKDYETSLEAHINKLEDAFNHHLIRSERSINNLNKLQSSKDDEITRLSREINGISNKINDLMRDSEYFEVDFDEIKDENVRHEEDVELLMKILKQTYLRAQRQETALIKELESVKIEKSKLESGSKMLSDYQKVDSMCKAAEMKKNELESKKNIQEYYIRRVLKDVKFVELNLTKLSKIFNHKQTSNAEISYLELRKLIKTIENFDDYGINNWNKCVMFSINDENIEEQVKHQEFSENKDNKNVLKFLIIRDENKLMEKYYQDIVYSFMNLSAINEEIIAYSAFLVERINESEKSFNSKQLKLNSHYDEIQKKIFESEIKIEINKWIFSLLDKCQCYQKSSQFIISANGVASTVTKQKIFALNPRVTEIFNDCEKEQIKIFESERTKAALTFKNLRISNEVEKCEEIFEKIKIDKSRIENEISSVEVDSLKITTDMLDTKFVEAEKTKEEIENQIKEVNYEIQKIKNEIELLEKEFDEILEKCKKLTILISKLDIDKLMEKSEVNNRTMDELRNESTKQHDLIMKINKIQKDLKLIVSKRDCLTVNFTNYLNNLDPNPDHNDIESLQEEIKSIKKDIQEMKEYLTKKININNVITTSTTSLNPLKSIILFEQ